MRSSDSGMVNLKGWPAAWCGVGCRLWGNMAPAAAGLPRSAALAVSPPPCPGFTPGAPRGQERRQPPAAFPPPPRAGAGPGAAQCPRRGDILRPRRPLLLLFRGGLGVPGGGGRAALGTVTAAPRSLGGAPADLRLPQARAGRDGTGPDGAGGTAAAPPRERIIPLSGSPVADGIVRPETPGGGDSSPCFCLLPGGGKSSRRKRDAMSAAGPSQAGEARESLQGGPRSSRASAEGPGHGQDTER